MMNRACTVVVWLSGIAGTVCAETVRTPIADTPFVQETHEGYPLGEPAGASDVRAVAVDPAGGVWAATQAGVFRLDKDKRQWSAVMAEADAGPAFAATTDKNGTVWAGAWNGLYRSVGTGLAKVEGITHPISAICTVDKDIVALGPDGLWRVRDAKVGQEPLPCARSVRTVLSDGKGGLWIATDPGLYHWTAKGTRCFQTDAGLVSARVRGLAHAPDGTL